MKNSNTKVKNKNRPTVAEYLRERLTDIPTTVLMTSYILFCFASLIYILATGQFEKTGNCIAFFLMGFLLYIAEYFFNVRSPYGYTVFLWLFLVGNFLGACYNFYALVPFYDDILHAAWSVAFGIIGIVIIKALVGVPKTKKAIVCYVLFGVAFVMLASVIWEIYEYSLDRLYHTMDMQPSTKIKHFHSFYLHDPYDGYHVGCIDGITKTVISYIKDGQPAEFVMDGYYLDMGITDTMTDLIYCFGATCVFGIILVIDWCNKKWLYRFIVPALVGEKYDKKGNLLEVEESAAVSGVSEVFADMGVTEQTDAAQSSAKDGDKAEKSENGDGAKDVEKTEEEDNV